MSFWLGVFAGLTLWQVVNALGGILLYGRETTIDGMTIGTSLFLSIVFATCAWYLATF
jgi:hypothetical protein